MLSIAVLGLAAVYMLVYGTASLKQHLTSPADRPAVLGGEAADTGTQYEQAHQRRLSMPTVRPDYAPWEPTKTF
tara:strand:- start:66 stop:287 length:222 start_codon:yes stop_codon:yes gene_type:complete